MDFRTCFLSPEIQDRYVNCNPKIQTTLQVGRHIYVHIETNYGFVVFSYDNARARLLVIARWS